MFLTSPLAICGEVELRIHHNLMGAMSALGQVERVCAHQQALAPKTRRQRTQQSHETPNLRQFAGQFARLPDWLAQAGDRVELALLGLAETPVILFGEWCAARHSLGYDHLPDWFLLFDVYDKTQGRFWSVQRRNALAETYGFATVPCLLQGTTSLDHLKLMLKETPSRYRSGSLEGVVIRHDSQDWCEARAKLVRPDFTQAIEEHWSRRRVEWNRLAVI